MDVYGGPPPNLYAAHHQDWLPPAAVARVQGHLDAIAEEFRIAATRTEPDQQALLLSLACFVHRMPATHTGRASDQPASP
jgi:hypothetical protein